MSGKFFFGLNGQNAAGHRHLNLSLDGGNMGLHVLRLENSRTLII
jgi:hypothetical protein